MAEESSDEVGCVALSVRSFYPLNTRFRLEKKTNIALNQFHVLKLALKVKSHKNST